MAYQGPDIWYTQDNSLDRSLNRLQDLAHDFFVKGREEKDKRAYDIRARQVLQAQKDYKLNPYEYGDPFENVDDFNRFMANVTDTQVVQDKALNYTPEGGTLSNVATKTVAAGFDPTEFAIDKNDIRIFESYLLGGTDLSKSAFFDGLVNQKVLLSEDADDLIDKGLLYAGEVSQWADPQVRNQVRKRWAKWKDSFISKNDIYKTDDDYADFITDLNQRERDAITKVKAEPDYELAWADAKSYGSRFFGTFAKTDKNNNFDGWVIGGKAYDTVGDIADAGFPISADAMNAISSDMTALEQYVDVRLQGLDSEIYVKTIQKLNKENPQLASWVDNEIRKYKGRVTGPLNEAKFASEVSQDNWARDMSMLLEEQGSVNNLLEPYVVEYTKVLDNFMTQARSNPGMFTSEDIENRMNQFLSLKLQEIQKIFSQPENANKMRDLYIQSQGGLSTIFSGQVRNYLRKAEEDE